MLTPTSQHDLHSVKQFGLEIYLSKAKYKHKYYSSLFYLDFVIYISNNLIRMVLHYKRKTDRANWSEDQKRLAILAVKEKEMSICQAAASYRTVNG